MEKTNKPIIKINDKSITVDDGKQIKRHVYALESKASKKCLNKPETTLKDVISKILSPSIDPNLLDREIVLEIAKKVQKIGFSDKQFEASFEGKMGTYELQKEPIVEDLPKTDLDSQEKQEGQNQSKYDMTTLEGRLKYFIETKRYSKCISELKSAGHEYSKKYLENLLTDDYHSCVEILLIMEGYKDEDRALIINEVSNNISEDISLEDLKEKINNAVDTLILNEIKDPEVEASENIEEMEETTEDNKTEKDETEKDESKGVEEDNSNKDYLEEIVSSINVDELVEPEPIPEAVRMLAELELQIEKEQTSIEIDEEKQENEKENESSLQKQDFIEKFNELWQKSKELDKKIKEKEEEIKQCDSIIYFDKSLELLNKKIEGIGNRISEINKKIKINPDEEEEWKQLIETRSELEGNVLKLKIFSNQFETEEDFKNALDEAIAKIPELEKAKDELEKAKDEIKRKIDELVNLNESNNTDYEKVRTKE